MASTDKLMIATRAEIATGQKFFKSYITNVKRVAVRDVTEHWGGVDIAVFETDYTFDYKGKSYRVNQSRHDHFNGTYELIEL